MTRSELFRSSVWFLMAGLVLFALLIAVGFFAFDPESREINFWMVAVMLLSFLSSMGFGGSFYLLIRGLCRRREYDPRAIYEYDLQEFEEGEFRIERDPRD